MEKKTRNALVLIGLLAVAAFVLVQAQPPDNGNGPQPIFQTDFSDAELIGNKLYVAGQHFASLVTHTGDIVEYDIRDRVDATGGKVFFMHVLSGQNIHARLSLTLARTSLGLGDRYSYKARIWFPENYVLDGWHSVATPIDEYRSGSTTEFKARIGLLDDGSGNFRMECHGGDWKTSPRVMIWKETKSVVVLTGQYNELIVDVYRHATEGTFKVTWNGVVLFNFQNVRTKMENSWNIRAVKLYGGEILNDAKRFDLDHLAIYSSAI